MTAPGKPTTSREIRQAFLDFFRARGHEVLGSGPLVPANDPTLMFANAGMVQFKDVFTGKDKRPYVRAATSQKCIRISGKHNDLENVGVTARHHTFFEMLGNFSFGDYFKQDAIAYAWEFLTGTLQIPKERLVVTIFGGEGALPADEEAAQLWAEVTGFGPERILRCGAKDNFWSMGDTGPCGPCTELHYYHGDGEADPARFGEEPGADGEGWTELWNLVFMQFDRAQDGTLTPLPAPSIDTGSGLERLAAVQQGFRSNYDTDLLRPVIDLAATISGKAYGGTLAPDDVSMRVIADHARTAALLIAEGVFPDRDGRSYVLRRVMRRAIRHGHRLGIDRLFLHECALVVVAAMGDVYPELRERRAIVEDVVRQEEERFRKTMRRGLELLAEATFESRGDARVLPGPTAFQLYDTFGFPLDLQDVIGQEQGFVVDHAGFEAEMERARERSAGSKVGEKAVDVAYHAVAESVGKTTFVGYDRERAEGRVVALLAGGARVEVLHAGQHGEVVVDVTPFYAESGGQVGDRGTIRGAGRAHARVRDTQKPVEGLFVHAVDVQDGPLSVGDTVTLEVDHALRTATRRNHSATHLLHYALRTVLGPQAVQKGSLVGPERLRFDYSGSRPLERDELRRLEDLVNAKILENADITTDVLPMDEAKQRGAIGLFEEKYGAVVRMLTMTHDSIELCGGTHAARTGDLGMFKIVGESGVAAGVRRIEATTGAQALRAVREVEDELARAAELLKCRPGEASGRVERLVAQQKEQQREIEALQRKLMSGGAGDLGAQAQEIAGAKVLGAAVDLGDANALRELADSLRDRLAPSVVLLGTATKDGKVALICTVSKELVGRFQAGRIVKEAAAVVGGGGGGRPDFAQAGGSDPSRLAEAVAKVYELVAAAG
jgi:alanyl-tRNA synthetase